MLGKGSSLTLCFEAVMNLEAVSTDLPVQGLLLLPWIPWRQETVGCVVQICSTALWPSSFFSSQKKLDLCWMCLTSCRRVGSYTTKTLSFITVIISQEISIHKHYPLCSCPLHNSSILLLFPARILQQLSEMDIQALCCAWIYIQKEQPLRIDLSLAYITNLQLKNGIWLYNIQR